MTYGVVRRDLAYHESGHAVVALTFGRTLKKIWIHGTNGQTNWTSNSQDFHPESMTKSDWSRVAEDLLILLAGEFAEKAYRESVEIYDDVYLSVHDRERVAELLERVGEHERAPVDLSMTALEKRVELKVQECWGKIEVLAETLIIKGEIDGADATFLIKSI